MNGFFLSEKIASFLLVLAKSFYKKRHSINKRVVEYLDDCIKNFSCIINYEKFDSSEVDISHKWLKHAHLDIFCVLGDLLTGNEVDVVRQSLMSGRIYYHAVRFGKLSDEDILFEYKGRLERLRRDIHNHLKFRKNSNEIVMSDVVRFGKVIPKAEKSRVLDQIRDVCMEDIGRLASFREKVKSKDAKFSSFG